MVILGMVCRVGLDDIRSQLTRLPHERDDEFFISIHLIAAALLVGFEDERFDHERHAIPVASGTQTGCIENGLSVQIGLAGHEQEIADHAGGIGLQGSDDRLIPMHELVEHHGMGRGIVEIANIRAQHEGWLARPGN